MFSFDEIYQGLFDDMPASDLKPPKDQFKLDVVEPSLPVQGSGRILRKLEPAPSVRSRLRGHGQVLTAVY